MKHYKFVKKIKPYKTHQKILVCLLPFLSLLLIYIFCKVFFKYLVNFVPPCGLYVITGHYCPGCGSTRAVRALMNGNLKLALRQSVLPFMAGFICFFLYLEWLLRAFGIKIRSPFRTYACLYISIALLLIYTVIRNFVPQIAPI